MRRLFGMLVTAAMVMLLLPGVVAAAGPKLHVDDDCSGSGDGSKVDPFCEIQDAVDVATDGTKIDVAPGTYGSVIFKAGYTAHNVKIDGKKVAGVLPMITGGIRFLNTANIVGLTLKELYISGEAQSSGGVIAFDQSGCVFR